MPTILHQMLALQGPKKELMRQSLAATTNACTDVSKLTGHAVSYVPFAEDDKDQPSDVLKESSRVQLTTVAAIRALIADISPSLDVILTVEVGNAQAKAPIMVDGVSIIMDAGGKPVEFPVSFLLELEKLFKDLIARVSKFQSLSETFDWSFDSGTGLWKAPPIQTLRRKKKFVNHEKAAATEHHPAQVEVFSEDVPVGTITRLISSGALSQQQHKKLLAQIEKVYTAVIAARHQANAIQVQQQHAAEKLLQFAFQPVLEGDIPKQPS